MHSPGSNSSSNSLKPFLIPPIHTPLSSWLSGVQPHSCPSRLPNSEPLRGGPQPASLLPGCSCPARSGPQVSLRTLPLPFALPGVSALWLLPVLRHQVLAWIFSTSPAMGYLRAFWQPLPTLPKQPAPLRRGGSSGMA